MINQNQNICEIHEYGEYNELFVHVPKPIGYVLGGHYGYTWSIDIPFEIVFIELGKTPIELFNYLSKIVSRLDEPCIIDREIYEKLRNMIYRIFYKVKEYCRIIEPLDNPTNLVIRTTLDNIEYEIEFYLHEITLLNSWIKIKLSKYDINEGCLIETKHVTIHKTEFTEPLRVKIT